MKYNHTLIYLIIILALGAFFRFYNLNWDQGHHLHPDERAIIMFALKLQLPTSLSEFFSPESPLNPNFFAYGNFPLYLLKATSVILSNFDKAFDSYEKINLVGRAISVIADLGTIIILYGIGRKIFNKTIGIISSLFYSLSVLPIQLAHFYAVDSLLTFFVTLTLFRLIVFYEKSTIKNSILVGLSFGLALSTKVSALPLIVGIFAAIFADFVLIFIKRPHKIHVWFPHLPKFLKKLFTESLIIIVITIITFIILQPYAIIDIKEFLRQTEAQSQMTKDAFTFPYTLQYVGKIPYVYELKNIFLWGQGPILATLSFLGTLYVCYRTMKQWNNRTIIILIFFFTYFFIVGKFAVGFMRYMLPLYPLLALFAGAFFYQLTKLKIFKQSFLLSLIFHFSFFIFILIWPLSFMHIYTKPNTRVLASQWIYQNVPTNKTIAREHWDDGLPIGGNIFYKTLELPIYEMENPIKEKDIYETINLADYIIIASNRLYAPLQRISKNCQKWNFPIEKCTHNARRYYEKLFNGELGYKKVAEFSTFPQLSTFNFKLSIDDSSADESFTVYDHPKVMIFKSIKKGVLK